MAPAPELVGAVLDGKLRIERLLASGAAGDVYEAHHLGLGTNVAVKVLRPGGGETADIRRRRFLREARVAARLRSPHVVRVYDVVEGEGGLTYIVMELLHGQTLGERLAASGALPIAEAVTCVRQAAQALAEMHDAGIIHRDVKPSNLFLAEGAPEAGAADVARSVKLLDFGVAALRQPLGTEEGSLTFSEAFVGTPRYMAPEQVRSSKGVDARADVWALGVTLYELLAGKPPFDGQTVMAVLHQIERGTPPSLEEARPEVPAALADVVRRTMAREPEARPANARALMEALAPFAEGRAEGGAAPESSRAGAGLGRRGRLAALGGAVILATLVVVVGLRTRGDASPAVTTEIVPTAAAASTALASSSSPSPDVPAPAAAPAASAAPAQATPSRADAAPRLRPRPTPRPPATTRPTRETDDRIE